MPTVKALFFDIDDTLYSTSDFARTARLNTVQAMIKAGLQMSVEECYHEYIETIEEFGSNFGSHIDKLLLRIPPERYQGINPAIIIAAGVVAYHKTKARGLIPFEDIPDVFDILKRHGFTLGIITEGLAVKQAEKLVRLDVLKFLDMSAVFITDQIGIGKRNPKLFRRACKHLGLEPALCAMVGDNPHKDIDPAKAAGMVTFLCRRSGKYISERGETEPDFTVNNMWDLLTILRREFGIPL